MYYVLVKVGDLQKALVETQKKADARKEEVQTKTKQVEKLEKITNDLKDRVCRNHPSKRISM